MRILVLNAGSGSEKATLYNMEGATPPLVPPPPAWSAQIDWIPQAGRARLQVETSGGAQLDEEIRPDSRPAGLAHMLQQLWLGSATAISGPGDVDVVGHRVVHGGREYEESALVTADVRAAIERLTPLAPLHNPAALEGMAAIDRLFSGVPQVAVFDTACHSRIPEAAAAYAGPYEWLGMGIRRYGFHGISHEYAANRAALLLNRGLESLRLITCHLGNGCSLAAIREGRSVDTTMGFTPLEGLMMAKRSGSVDPGILLYLQREKGMTVDRVDHALNEASGLLGISGVGADMRQVMEAVGEGSERARLAVDMFVHSLRRHIGAMLGSLGGLDALVFTGGIGENAAAIRAAACEPFAFLGLTLDPALNDSRPVDSDIAASDSAVRLLVIQSQENWAVARECFRLTAPRKP